MDSIPNFTPAEMETVRQLVHQRYSEPIEIQLSDSTLMHKPKPERRVNYPMLFWHVRSANFVVIRSGLNRFRCQFFYTPHDQYDTGRKEYDSLEQCVITLLQAQENHKQGHDLS